MEPPSKSRKNEQMKEWIKEIKSRKNLSSFFEKILQSQNFHGDLFLLGSETLAPKSIAGNVIPSFINPRIAYLGWSNTDDINSEISFPIKFDDKLNEETKESTEDEGDKNASFLDEEDISDGMKQLLSFAVIKSIRTSPKLKHVLALEHFDYHSFLKETKGAKDFGVDEALKDYEGLFDNGLKSLFVPTPEDPPEVRVAKKLFRTIIEKFKFDPVRMIHSFPWDFILLNLGKALVKHPQDLMRKTNLSKDVYDNIIIELMNDELLESYWSCWYCKTCTDEEGPCLSSRTQLPLPLNNISCPKCRTPMNSFSVMRLDPLIVEIILSDDGLLSAAIAYHLEEKGFEWDFSIYKSGMENDFVINHREKGLIIEVKMFEEYKSEDGKINTRKAKEKIKKFLKKQICSHLSETDVNTGFLVINIRDGEIWTICDEIIKELEEKNTIPDGKRIKVVGWDRFTEEIESFLQS